MTKTPNTNAQDRRPSRSPRRLGHLVFAVLNLFVIWDLEFGVFAFLQGDPAVPAIR
jgi:hypothetical protein